MVATNLSSTAFVKHDECWKKGKNPFRDYGIKHGLLDKKGGRIEEYERIIQKCKEDCTKIMINCESELRRILL